MFIVIVTTALRAAGGFKLRPYAWRNLWGARGGAATMNTAPDPCSCL